MYKLNKKYHTKIAHSVDHVPCLKCNLYLQPKDMIRHLRLDHQMDIQFVCPWCLNFKWRRGSIGHTEHRLDCLIAVIKQARAKQTAQPIAYESSPTTDIATCSTSISFLSMIQHQQKFYNSIEPHCRQMLIDRDTMIYKLYAKKNDQIEEFRTLFNDYIHFIKHKT